ncbi:MAG: 16S rRNA (cytosine(1402)-N(4))-methyltransferase RsmH [Patescibacteria group bacterium]
MNTFHTPVMLEEVLNALDVGEGKKYIDATVGGGGHSIEIVKRGGKVLGIDQDPEAVEFVRQNFNWNIVQGNFRDIEKIAQEHGFDKVDGILFDLGVSSHQIDTPERGFSFRFPDAPLDLRMDPGQGMPVSEKIRHLSREELYEIFAKYGEEKLARSIAHAFVRSRGIRAITKVGAVIEIVGSVVKGRTARISTLARVFQALRILVNDELAALKEGILGGGQLLTSGGRMVVLSYHSLEDRIVKQAMMRSPLIPFIKKSAVASGEEITNNPRGRSAKLRVAKKI